MSAACSRHADDFFNLARRTREKRTVHHHPPHRQLPKNDKRKLREKRKNANANFISTDGTTSGDDATEHVLAVEPQEHIPSSNRLSAFLRKHEQSMTSDLEADCEDNNSTDMDTISSSFNLSQAGVEEIKSDAEPSTQVPEPQESETTVQSLNARIIKLEKQLETVLNINVKLKEENEKLRREIR
uniref:PRKC apoptosis WT1 regulator protein n=1 Tax=Steinernema glaseri TaxID=37863 RepID=A0A1I8AVS6_9BILA